MCLPLQDTTTDKDFITKLLKHELENATVPKEPVQETLTYLFDEDTLPVGIEETFSELKKTSYKDGKL